LSAATVPSVEPSSTTMIVERRKGSGQDRIEGLGDVPSSL